ncbi:hypothetical protein GCM10009753_17430 [Streptantibioticus ferralitis]
MKASQEAPEGAVRFVALGDSLTEGLGDPVPGGWRGWAALLADGMAEAPDRIRFLNCARSGALTVDVGTSQLAEARAFRPDVAAVVAGANDTLRGSFDIDVVTARLDATLGGLSADGVTLLTACLPDPGQMLGLPWPLARPLGRRMRAVNHVVHVLSERYEAVHLHAADHPWAADRASWSVDRLHPSEVGHRLLAYEFHALLAARGLAVGEPPRTTPDGPPPSRAASAWWMATRGTGWVVDRCSDLLPDLLRLAAAECRHRAAGSCAALEETAHRSAVAAVAALSQARHQFPAAAPSLPSGTNRTGIPGAACAAEARLASGTTPMTG